MKELENAILIWQFIAAVCFVIALFLAIAHYESVKRDSNYLAETVSVIKFSNKQKQEILDLRKALKDKIQEYKDLEETITGLKS